MCYRNVVADCLGSKATVVLQQNDGAHEGTDNMRLPAFTAQCGFATKQSWLEFPTQLQQTPATSAGHCSVVQECPLPALRSCSPS